MPILSATDIEQDREAVHTQSRELAKEKIQDRMLDRHLAYVMEYHRTFRVARHEGLAVEDSLTNMELLLQEHHDELIIASIDSEDLLAYAAAALDIMGMLSILHSHLDTKKHLPGHLD
jgi:hypothetical protein